MRAKMSSTAALTRTLPKVAELATSGHTVLASATRLSSSNADSAPARTGAVALASCVASAGTSTLHTAESDAPSDSREIRRQTAVRAHTLTFVFASAILTDSRSNVPTACLLLRTAPGFPSTSCTRLVIASFRRRQSEAASWVARTLKVSSSSGLSGLTELAVRLPPANWPGAGVPPPPTPPMPDWRSAAERESPLVEESAPPNRTAAPPPPVTPPAAPVGFLKSAPLPDWPASAASTTVRILFASASDRPLPRALWKFLSASAPSPLAASARQDTALLAACLVSAAPSPRKPARAGSNLSRTRGCNARPS
mmetsp:Transcript_46172/g.107845  ORF Transcript_46172/g.107845 Transcript_46172/m.107845 type:complete len:311 (+) Transcript_46172:436-1368(+)